ncbi:cysteine--tRNA ligase [Qipengyuania aurantiaca]|uniref:Cysteine--tRNA ligase n=1 Tax=Qipengyuania aurantiaca TaxID=2867233 RepID=A0ABX8ZS60_9SPHN|nr:cysteine--tRNA ligase [Qipengyuania aurantiaca]QZD90018.1 cysteine--tRNA ligase [Qipengyuania aurantiaca]
MTETPLKLFNSLTREIETFTPVHPGEARVYTCGPTVYNYPHIGNMRAYVFADVLGRTLSWKGYDLTHIINITDVGHLTDDADEGEDKMEKMAAERAQSIWDIAKHYTEAYWADVKALNIRQPAKWSVATDYIDEMIEFAKGIADKHCYEIDEGLYFDVTTIQDYAKLAGPTKLDQIRENEEAYIRIDKVSGKRNAADFAIWRKTPAGETRQMEWDSPWGKGAPGWHLECSVMGGKLLGFPFDIHTGGIDHREIHHPNEIAQNQAYCCTGGLGEAENSGARIWMHNNFLVERSGKMSKSAGEFLRLQLLIDKGYHPLAYRMMCLQAHYRSELEFSWDGLQAALTRLKRIVMQVERLKDQPSGSGSRSTDAIVGMSFRETFDFAINDDLNTPLALTALENALALKKVDLAALRSLIEYMDDVLGFDLMNLTREDLRVRPKDAHFGADEVEAELVRRKEARADKDYALSDAIRDNLMDNGIKIMDGDPLGWEWKL